MLEKFESGAIKPGTEIDVKDIRIGQYADYINTGIWTLKDGYLIAPEDLTIDQLKDHLKISGGGLYLRGDGKLCWGPNKK